MKYFESEITDISTIELESAKLIFNQAEKSLQSHVDSYRSLSEKALKLSTFVVSIMTLFIGLFSYVFKMDAMEMVLKSVYLNSLGTVIFLYALACLAFILAHSPRKLSFLGGSPKDLLLLKFFEIKGSLQVVNLLFNETENYQNFINFNAKQINIKSWLIIIGLWCFYLAPFVGLVVYFLS